MAMMVRGWQIRLDKPSTNSRVTACEHHRRGVLFLVRLVYPSRYFRGRRVVVMTAMTVMMATEAMIPLEVALRSDDSILDGMETEVETGTETETEDETEHDGGEQ